MDWYIVYKGKARKNSLRENLIRANISYYIPTQHVESSESGKTVIYEEESIKNLIFIQTERPIQEVANTIDGLRCPYVDRNTNHPAIVKDEEMQRFMRFMEYTNLHAKVLSNPYNHFKVNQKVRVKSGDFEGTVGYIVRIRRDRKLVVALGNMAVAISGIPFSLFEKLD